ncbi:ATPase [bacterium]|nr:ATPase [bacterium]
MTENTGAGGKRLRIAVPTSDGKLVAHLGHCREFMLFDVDPEACTIEGSSLEVPPAHEPGVLPAWLLSLGAQVVIAGGMGQMAQQLFAKDGIDVLVGVGEAPAESIVLAYLNGEIKSGSNLCDH